MAVLSHLLGASGETEASALGAVMDPKGMVAGGCQWFTLLTAGASLKGLLSVHTYGYHTIPFPHNGSYLSSLLCYILCLCSRSKCWDFLGTRFLPIPPIFPMRIHLNTQFQIYHQMLMLSPYVHSDHYFLPPGLLQWSPSYSPSSSPVWPPVSNSFSTSSWWNISKELMRPGYSCAENPPFVLKKKCELFNTIYMLLNGLVPAYLSSFSCYP